MFTAAIREIKTHPTRMVATLVAIAISIGFLAGISVFVATEQNAMGSSYARHTTMADLVVSKGVTIPGEPDQERELEQLLASEPRITDFEAIAQAHAPITKDTETALVKLYSIPSEQYRWMNLTQGTWPKNTDEIILPAPVAKQLKADIGDTVNVQLDVNHKMEIVGISDETDLWYLTPAYTDLTHLQGISKEWLITARDDTDLNELAKDLDNLVTAKFSVENDIGQMVLTSESYRKHQVLAMTGDMDVFKYMLQGFGVLALLVGMIIIANTFTILIAQRRRQIGLLRAIGASKTQVRRKLLAEATLLGMGGSTLGIALGIGIAMLASWYTGSLYWGVQMPWAEIGIVFAIGVIATILATYLPTRRATKIAPLEALRVVPVAESAKAGKWRIAICALFALAGAYLVWQSQRDVATDGPTPTINNFVYAIGAGICITIAVLGLASIYIPWLMRLFGKTFGRFSPQIRLAAENGARNPKRASSTAIAVMLAMGLIVTLQVAVASARTTGVDAIRASMPVDISVTSAENKPLSDDIVARVKEIPGIEKHVLLPGVEVRIPEDGDQTLIVLDGELAKDFSPRLAEELTDGKMLAAYLASDEPLAVRGELGDVMLDITHSNTQLPGVNLVNHATFTKLAKTTQSMSLWVQLESGTDLNQIYNQLNKLQNDLVNEGSVNLGGSALTASTFLNAMEMVLLVMSALLGVSVIVALVGVANTLGLSVLERRRENALLRALGMQRSGIRVMLLIEALLLALVGAVVGIVAGFFFGWLATSSSLMTVPKEHRPAMHFSIDMGWTLLLLAIAAGSAALASILPGAKAAKATPTQALAQE